MPIKLQQRKSSSSSPAPVLSIAGGSDNDRKAREISHFLEKTCITTTIEERLKVKFTNFKNIKAHGPASLCSTLQTYDKANCSKDEKGCIALTESREDTFSMHNCQKHINAPPMCWSIFNIQKNKVQHLRVESSILKGSSHKNY